MRNRGADALDVVDIGVIVSDHARPDFAAFLDLWGVFPLGYAHVDGELIGIGGGRVGVVNFQHRDSWGALLWGAEQHAVGRQRPPSADPPPRYDQGLLRLALASDHPPPTERYFDCDRTLHVGWIGLHLRVKLDDLLDFVLGWTGMDPMHDDLEV